MDDSKTPEGSHVSMPNADQLEKAKDGNTADKLAEGIRYGGHAAVNSADTASDADPEAKAAMIVGKSAANKGVDKLADAIHNKFGKQSKQPQSNLKPGSMDNVHVPKADSPYADNGENPEDHSARNEADYDTRRYADGSDKGNDKSDNKADNNNFNNKLDSAAGKENDGDRNKGDNESTEGSLDKDNGQDIDDGEIKGSPQIRWQKPDAVDGDLAGRSPEEALENSKTMKQAEGNPIAKAAERLGKGANGSKGQALVRGAKSGAVAGGKLAILYAGGRLFDKAMEMLGLAINGASAAVQAAIVHSPIGFWANLAHDAYEFGKDVVGHIEGAVNGAIHGVQNAAHAVGQGLGQVGHGIANAGHGIMNGLNHAAGGIAHMANNAINSVTSVFTGHTVQAATISTATVVHAGQGLCATAALLGVGYGLTFFNAGQRDYTQPPACQALVDNAETGGKVNANQKEEANAKMAYSVFKTYGMSDAAIAGILGNWSQESGIDPTILEGFSGIEMYHIGPRKKAALANLSGYAKKCAAAAGGNYSGYGNCPGLGLGQWTSGRGLKLMAAAKKAGGDHHWYDMDFQLAYVIAEPQDSHPALNLKKYAKQTSVSAATRDWFLHWEGIDDGTGPKREAAAEGWYKKMKNWKVDNKEANSILAMAKHLGSKATAVAVNDAANNCKQAIAGADDSSLVWAALSFAWDSDDLAKGNNGTPLYQKVHKAIFPGDPWFQSCDRVVACAVRWSGTDIKYPAGATDRQYQYVMSSSKWKKVGTTNSMHYSEIKPGDIYLDSGIHTFLFVGNAAVKESIKRNMHSKTKTPANGDEVDGSLNQRSAGIGVDGKYAMNHGDQGRTYTIFRNVKNDKSNKYKSVAKMPSTSN